ncbi:MAG: hypothetical protein IKY83_13620 [Proteobacteria bacterium]|nr:hypothetical protein [Pseudomonadota bacterium]
MPLETDTPLQHKTLPEFHGQLCLSEPQKFGGAADWYGIFPSSRQRMWRFLSGFSTKFLLAAAFLAVLFVPDFVLDYAHRGENFVKFFWLIVAACLGIILIASVVLTFLHEMRLYVSLGSGKIILGRALNDTYARDTLAISEIKELQIEPPSAVFKRSRLIAICGDSGYLLAETYGSHDDLIELRDWLNEAHSNT